MRGRRWQVTAWPSAEPGRRLGPGRVLRAAPDRSGMQPFPTELEPPEAGRALATIVVSTDNGRESDTRRRLGPTFPPQRTSPGSPTRGMRIAQPSYGSFTTV